MPNEKAPIDFKAVIKENADKYKLAEPALQMKVREELTALVAKKIAEQIVAGDVAPPEKLGQPR